jgi:hypothetical protein
MKYIYLSSKDTTTMIQLTSIQTISEKEKQTKLREINVEDDDLFTLGNVFRQILVNLLNEITFAEKFMPY